MTTKPNIGIFIFDGVELLDAAGPLEVFAVADELSGGNFGRVLTFGITTQPVKSVAGLQLIPDRAMADVQALDVLVVPGGEGVRHWMCNSMCMDELKRIGRTCTVRMTVCSGALAAAKLGWIKQTDFCTHHLVAHEVAELLPKTARWRNDLRFTGSDGLYTSAGISAGIDLALYLVAQLHSADLGNKVAGYLEYTSPQG